MASRGSFPSILNLNVGGIVYATTLKTITRDPKSLLGRMFNGTHEVACDSKGNYFIDRDGSLFRHVLNFLRTWELCLPQPFDELEQLSAEADFYEVGDLVKALQILREDRRKNKPSSKHQVGTIIVSVQRPYQKSWDQCSISGRLELVREIFEEYMNLHEGNHLHYCQQNYLKYYPISITNLAIAFDLLYSFGFQLESCINQSMDNNYYFFMRKK